MGEVTSEPRSDECPSCSGAGTVAVSEHIISVCHDCDGVGIRPKSRYGSEHDCSWCWYPGAGVNETDPRLGAGSEKLHLCDVCYHGPYAARLVVGPRAHEPHSEMSDLPRLLIWAANHILATLTAPNATAQAMRRREREARRKAPGETP